MLQSWAAYNYDQLNRIKESQAFTNLNISTNIYGTASPYLGSYNNTFTYDANGNILNQVRKNQAGGVIDNLTYNYHSNSGRKLQNRLYSVNDATITPSITDDIEDQGVYQNSLLSTVNKVNNYRYDEIGNLKHDSIEQINEIKWTVYGKIKEITRKSGSTKNNLKFDYDASGNRIAKHVLSSANVLQSSVYYARDAQGNVMSIYKKNPAGSSFMLTERHIYGSSRLGSDKQANEMVSALPLNLVDTSNRCLGNKYYELANHLGNVLAVVSDKRIPRQLGATGTIGNYEADIISSTDYYAFGAPMSGRSFSSPSYRYGFNGKEKDDEINVGGNAYDFGARIYDSRLGRWLAVDPLVKNYPSRSPYNYSSNCPIYYKDGRVQTDLFGRVIYEVDNSKSPHTESYSGYYVTVRNVFVFLNTGEKIPVEQYTIIDKKTGVELVNTTLEVTYNCHGHSTLKDKFKVNSIKKESNALLLDKGGFTQTDDLQTVTNKDFSKIEKGDIIVLFNSKGVAIHSYLYTGKDVNDNKVSSKNGDQAMNLNEGVTKENVYQDYQNAKKVDGSTDPDNSATSWGFIKPVSDKIINTDPNKAKDDANGSVQKTSGVNVAVPVSTAVSSQY